MIYIASTRHPKELIDTSRVASACINPYKSHRAQLNSAIRYGNAEKSRVLLCLYMPTKVGLQYEIHVKLKINFTTKLKLYERVFMS